MWRYADSTRSVILALKNRNGRAIAGVLAADMATRLVGSQPDIVTWAPTARSRLARRGYDPAELLARSLARRLGVPCRCLLRRAPHSGPQSGKNREARMEGPRFVGRAPAPPGRVLVVDDVITTGATLLAATDALLRAGARSVTCLAAAAA